MEMKKCDVFYNEELKKFWCVYIYINCIYIFFLIDNYLDKICFE